MEQQLVVFVLAIESPLLVRSSAMRDSGAAIVMRAVVW